MFISVILGVNISRSLRLKELIKVRVLESLETRDCYNSNFFSFQNCHYGMPPIMNSHNVLLIKKKKKKKKKEVKFLILNFVHFG